MAVTLSREMHLTFSSLQQYNLEKAIPMNRHEHLSIKIDIEIVVLGQTNNKDFFVLKKRNLKSNIIFNSSVG